jgi:pimeloyl-ACP methyl ester carboxylesterase
MIQTIQAEAVRIPADGALLPGDLVVPAGTQGIVLFVHGSGSSRFSTRNRHVAGALQDAHLATLLFDLLTEEEDADPAARFDIGLLTRRLLAARRFVASRADLSGLRVGYFGASTGAAAALGAAAENPGPVAAVVSRGGRPDLVPAGTLARVRVPVLLVVGARDEEVLTYNRSVLRHLPLAQLAVVRDATHLFEEPGALEEVARLAAGWFKGRLVPCVPSRAVVAP